MEEIIDKVITTKQTIFTQLLMVKDRDFIFLDSRIFPEFNAKNEVISVLCVSRDITYLKQSEIHLHQLNNDNDRFISILGHDLKSPLSSMVDFLDILSKRVKNYDINTVEKQLHMLHDSSKRIYSLLEDILVWARANSGKISFEPQKIIFLSIYNETIGNLKLSLVEKVISVNSQITDELIVYADIYMLKTVMRNLLSNAIKFTNKGGHIDVVAEQTYSSILITVCDNGIGISADSISKLFDFKQIYTTRGTANEKGTGLGLVLCKEFIEKHGGKIWVESKPGLGSNFKFTLPFEHL